MERMNILIVDDEPMAIEFLLSMLKKTEDAQWIPHPAGSPAEALAIARNEPMDVMITDLNMPSMDGLSLIDSVHALQPACLVIILTAYPQFETAQKAISRGVFEYVTKLDMRLQLPAVLQAAAQKIAGQRQLSLHEALYRQRQLSDEQDFQALLSTRPPKTHEQARLLNRLHFLTAAKAVYVVLLADTVVPADRLYSAFLGEPRLLNLCIQADPLSRLTALLQLNAAPNEAEGVLQGMVLEILAQQEGLKLVAVQVRGEDFASASSLAQRELEARTGSGLHFLADDGQARESHHEQLLASVAAYIQEHIAEDITLSQLSAVFGYTPTYLSSLFHRHSGEKLQQYVNRRKLELIQSLMLNPALTMNSISLRSGFTSRSTFNRFIARYTGLTPREYRKSLLHAQRETADSR